MSVVVAKVCGVVHSPASNASNIKASEVPRKGRRESLRAETEDWWVSRIQNRQTNNGVYPVSSVEMKEETA